MILKKIFFKLMNNSVFGKTMENVRKHRDIKLVTTDKRRNQLVSQPNCHTENYFSENLLAIQMKKKKIKKCFIGNFSNKSYLFKNIYVRMGWGCRPIEWGYRPI